MSDQQPPKCDSTTRRDNPITPATSSQFDADAHRLQVLIQRRQRRLRLTPLSGAELKEAIDQGLRYVARRRAEDAANESTAKPSAKPSSTAVQADLLDHGGHAAATRAEAARKAGQRSPSIKARVIDRLAQCGVYGATREELASSLAIPIQSITGPVCELLRGGRLIEPGPTRPTRSGCRAAVLRLAKGNPL